jgi:signal transduction histidine kinase
MLRDASLGRRLLVGAAVFITVALVIAAIAIGFVLHRFVQGQIDQRLDTEIVFLASMLRADTGGTLSLAGSADGPPFDRPARGWYWQVNGPSSALRSRSLGDATLDVPALPSPPGPPPPSPKRDDRPPAGERPRPADGPGPDGVPLHFRVQSLSVSGIPATLIASAPRDAVIGPWREAMATLALSLAALGVALVLAIVLQVRLGLRPLERLRRALADVRAGRRERVPVEQPAEIRPLVVELNALLAQNAANLERARRHVANLAHGLKTPLATLAVALSARGADSGELNDLVDVMERRIRHHLGRARAAALNGPVRARTLVAPHLEALGEVLRKVHASRGIVLTIDVTPDLAIACERQDFDEIAGNLLENAFKWTRGTVDVRARADQDRTVTLTIDDDGPGLRPDQIPQVMQPGQRLDESAPGFGFGLSITRELVELYGGTLDLGRAPQGGLRVSLRLPIAPTA